VPDLTVKARSVKIVIGKPVDGPQARDFQAANRHDNAIVRTNPLN
jgi:hypothetical protein